VVPRELAAVDDDAADGRPVARDPLRRRLPNDVGAVLERPTEVGVANVLSTTSGTAFSWAISASRSKSGVTSEGFATVSTWTNAVSSSIASAYASSSSVSTSRASTPRRFAMLVRVRGRAAVHLGTGDDVVARAREHGRYRVERGHPRAGRDRVGAARQVGDPVFEDAHGRVGEPGVDVALRPERVHLRRRLRVVEDERGRLVDRGRARPGRRVGLGAGVETPGVEPTCHVCSAYIYKHL